MNYENENKAYFKIGDDLNQRLNRIFRLLLIIYIIYTGLIIDYRFICPGLDSSHFFAINYFANNNIIFGKDVIWTYGPLGFLLHPMDIGRNLGIAILFQISLWVIFSATIIYLALKRSVSTTQLSLFAVFLTISTATGLEIDYIISLLVILFLSIAYVIKRWHIPYFLALIFTTFLWFIKLNPAILSTSAVISFVILNIFTDRKIGLRAAVLASLCIPILLVTSYMLYNNSMPDMLSYLKGIAELASGYSVAMSYGGEAGNIVVLPCFFIFYILISYLIYKTKQSSFPIAMTLIVPILILVKHGFIRSDEHIFSFLGFSFVILAVIFLFTDVRKIMRSAEIKRAWKYLSVLSISSYLVLCSYLYTIKPDLGYQLNNIVSILNYSYTKEGLDALSKYYISNFKIQPAFFDKIGTSSISVFPWETLPIAAGKLNYKPFPVFQSYAAYTSYLDNLNSAYLEDLASSPKFILMNWQAIDGRHPLSDVPAEWLSMYKWYNIDGKNAGSLLLKRRSGARFNSLELIERKQCKKEDYIKVPFSDNPVILKIHMKLDPLGEITKVLFRIPAVKMQLFIDPNIKESFRITPDTLKDGLLINFLPLTLEEAAALIGSDKATHKTIGLKLSGEGLRYYSDTIIVEFYKIPSISITSRKN